MQDICMLMYSLSLALSLSLAHSLCHSIDYDTDASTRHSFSVSSTNIPVPPYLTPRSIRPQVLEASLSFILLIQTPSSKRAEVEEKVLVGLSVAAIAGVRSKVACCEYPQRDLHTRQVLQTAVMARRRRRRRPGGHTTAVGSGGRRTPISTDTASHTHTARSLACPLLTLSSARPFSNGIFRSNGAPASLPPASSSLTHARRMDGFCNQNADKLGSLAGPSLLTVYVGVVECAPASLSPASSSLTHARRMDGFCNQNADKLGSLAGPSLLIVYVGVVECAPASLSPASSSLTHARRMDGFCNQNADQLGYLAGQSF
jgi:hypothetical protein